MLFWFTYSCDLTLSPQAIRLAIAGVVPARPKPPFLVGPDWQAELLKDDVLTTVKMFHNACCEALLTLVQENRFETDKVNGIRIIRLKSKEELEIEKMKIKVSWSERSE